MKSSEVFYLSLPHIFARGGAGVSSEKTRVSVRKISVSEADGYVKTDQDVLVEQLKEIGLFGNQYLYHAFPPARKAMVLNTGTPHRQNGPRANEIDCLAADELGTNDDTNIFDYMASARGARNFDFGVIAVYDKKSLEPRKIMEGDDHPSHPYYQFKDPTHKRAALVAVVEIHGLYDTGYKS